MSLTSESSTGGGHRSGLTIGGLLILFLLAFLLWYNDDNLLGIRKEAEMITFVHTAETYIANSQEGQEGRAETWNNMKNSLALSPANDIGIRQENSVARTKPTDPELCPCRSAHHAWEMLKKRSIQRYNWKGSGRVPLFYANLDRSKGRRKRMDYVLGSKNVHRVIGLDQRNIEGWVKHNIYTPDEYLYKYFRSKVPRRPGEFGATMSHLKQVWSAYAYLVKRAFPEIYKELESDIEKQKKEFEEKSIERSDFDNWYQAYAKNKKNGNFPQEVVDSIPTVNDAKKGEKGDMRGDAKVKFDDTKSGDTKSGKGNGKSDDKKEKPVAETPAEKPHSGDEKTGGKSPDGDVKVASEEHSSGLSPSEHGAGDHADGDHESSSKDTEHVDHQHAVVDPRDPNGSPHQEIAIKGDSATPSHQQEDEHEHEGHAAEGHAASSESTQNHSSEKSETRFQNEKDEEGGANGELESNNKPAASDKGHVVAAQVGAESNTDHGDRRRLTELTTNAESSLENDHEDFENDHYHHRRRLLTEEGAATWRRVRRLKEESTTSSSSASASSSFSLDFKKPILRRLDPRYRNAEGELIDWTLELSDVDFYRVLSPEDRRFSAVFFEDDTSTASKDIGWGSVSITDFADALDRYKPLWETLRLGTNNCDEPWRVDKVSDKPFSDSVFGIDRLECFGATSYMVSLIGMRKLLKKYLVAQRRLPGIAHGLFEKKAKSMETNDWEDEIIVTHAENRDCEPFWCAGDHKCLKKLKIKYHETSVRDICEEKLQIIKDDIKKLQRVIHDATQLGLTAEVKKKKRKLESLNDALRWEQGGCVRETRELMGKFHNCIDRIIKPDVKILDLKIANRFSVPKFNITGFVGLYPVADVLIFQEALNVNAAFRLRHNYIFESIFELEPVLSHGHIPTALDDEFAIAGMVSTLKAREKAIDWVIDLSEDPEFVNGIPMDIGTRSEWQWLFKRSFQNPQTFINGEPLYYINLDRSKRRRKRIKFILGADARRVRALDHYDTERFRRLSLYPTAEELATKKPTRHNRIGEHALTISHLFAVYQGFVDFLTMYMPDGELAPEVKKNLRGKPSSFVELGEAGASNADRGEAAGASNVDSTKKNSASNVDSTNKKSVTNRGTAPASATNSGSTVRNGVAGMASGGVQEKPSNSGGEKSLPSGEKRALETANQSKSENVVASVSKDTTVVNVVSRSAAEAQLQAERTERKQAGRSLDDRNPDEKSANKSRDEKSADLVDSERNLSSEQQSRDAIESSNFVESKGEETGKGEREPSSDISGDDFEKSVSKSKLEGKEPVKANRNLEKKIIVKDLKNKRRNSTLTKSRGVGFKSRRQHPGKKGRQLREVISEKEDSAEKSEKSEATTGGESSEVAKSNADKQRSIVDRFGAHEPIKDVRIPRGKQVSKTAEAERTKMNEEQPKLTSSDEEPKTENSEGARNRKSGPKRPPRSTPWRKMETNLAELTGSARRRLTEVQATEVQAVEIDKALFEKQNKDEKTYPEQTDGRKSEEAPKVDSSFEDAKKSIIYADFHSRKLVSKQKHYTSPVDIQKAKHLEVPRIREEEELMKVKLGLPHYGINEKRDGGLSLREEKEMVKLTELLNLGHLEDGTDDLSVDDVADFEDGPPVVARKLESTTAILDRPPQTYNLVKQMLALTDAEFLAKLPPSLQNYAITIVEDDIATGARDIGWGDITLTDLRDSVYRYDRKWETLRLGTSNCEMVGGNWNSSFVMFLVDTPTQCYGAVAYMVSLLGIRRLLKKFLVRTGAKPKFDITLFEGRYPVADLLMFSNPHAWRVQTNYLFESINEPSPVLKHGHIAKSKEEALIVNGIMNTYRAREQAVDVRLNVWTK